MEAKNEAPDSILRTIDKLLMIEGRQEFLEIVPELRELLDFFATASEHGRDWILAFVNEKHSAALLAYAHEMAENAVRKNSIEDLRCGLLAIVVERALSDFRDTLHEIALLYHSCLRIGADPNELFHDAADIADGETADLLLGFPRRPARQRELAAWSYREGMGPDGFRYESTYKAKR